MKRRTFLIRSTMAAAAATLLPQVLLGAAKNGAVLKKVNLPDTLSHVRHGLWQSADKALSGLPSWISQLQKDRFFGNGLEQGPNDLVHITLRLEGEPVVTLGFEKDGIWVGKEDLVQWVAKSGTRQQLDLDTDNYVLEVIETGKKQTLKLPNGANTSLLLSVEGDTLVEGELLTENSALWLDGVKELTFEVGQTNNILLITKTK